MSGCSVEGCGWKHKAKGLCKNHYRQSLRGTLDNPRYSVPKRMVGTPLRYGFEVKKINDVWHRRPTDSRDPWVPVVWSAHAGLEEEAA